MATGRLRLPTGIQTFRDIREGGFYYVDKTGYALQAAEDGKFLFLSRPRRFGKSLFLDTLAELYAGSKPLFRGLAVHDRWDWSRHHPVLRLSFAGDYSDPNALRQDLMEQLDGWERDADIHSGYDTARGRLRHLLAGLRRRTGQRAVVLVDEYDKPILDALGDPATAAGNRAQLRSLFGTVKDCDAHIEKCFVTGICRFPRTSLFSTANQFTDRTLDRRYNAVCGFTDEELDRAFAPELEGLDRDAIRQRYNGYSWAGEGFETVYNPYDVLLLFDSRRFVDHWWRTGTPSFLVQHLERHGLLDIGDLDGRWVEEERLSDFDLERMDAAALMFQTGYLTVGREETRNDEPGCWLAYPNEEVRRGMGRLLARHAIGDRLLADRCGEDLRAAVENADLDRMEETMRRLYASLPHQQIAFVDSYEALYAVALRTLAMGAGIRSTSEESTALGRSDVTLSGGGNVFVFEFKMKGRGDPLEQAARKGYADRHRHLRDHAWVVGVTMNADTCNIERFETARPFLEHGGDSGAGPMDGRIPSAGNGSV